MKKIAVILVIAGFMLSAFAIADRVAFKVPRHWPKPQYDFSANSLRPAVIELGRALFYDPVLSRDSTVSCASCHSQYTAFAHVDHDLSHGINDKIGKRNAPALVNLAWQKHFMWDGAVTDLDRQSLKPISHPDEMGEEVDRVLAKLQRSTVYPGLFFNAYGDNTIAEERMLKALSQFMLTLVSANSKYDMVMRREETFSLQEENGYRLFRQHCAGCHNEPLFTNGTFASNGLSIDTGLNDRGRAEVTGRSADAFLFKIPTLRNIEFSYPYMHDGRFKKLSEVVNHYTKGIQQNATLSKELRSPIQLTANEKVDLVAFLLTLTDKEFLFNPAFSYPKNIFRVQAKE